MIPYSAAELAEGERLASLVRPSRCPGNALALRCDRAAFLRLRARCRSGEAERDLAAVVEARDAAQRARWSAQLAAMNAARAAMPEAGDVVARAERYLAKLAQDGPSHEALRRAAVALVRGFALAEEEALAVLVRGYPGRVSRSELLRQVRGAARSERVGLGYLLG